MHARHLHCGCALIFFATRVLHALFLLTLALSCTLLLYILPKCVCADVCFHIIWILCADWFLYGYAQCVYVYVCMSVVYVCMSVVYVCTYVYTYCAS